MHWSRLLISNKEYKLSVISPQLLLLCQKLVPPSPTMQRKHQQFSQRFSLVMLVTANVVSNREVSLLPNSSDFTSSNLQSSDQTDADSERLTSVKITHIHGCDDCQCKVVESSQDHHTTTLTSQVTWVSIRPSLPGKYLHCLKLTTPPVSNTPNRR